MIDLGGESCEELLLILGARDEYEELFYIIAGEFHRGIYGGYVSSVAYFFPYVKKSSTNFPCFGEFFVFSFLCEEETLV